MVLLLCLPLRVETVFSKTPKPRSSFSKLPRPPPLLRGRPPSGTYIILNIIVMGIRFTLVLEFAKTKVPTTITIYWCVYKNQAYWIKWLLVKWIEY